MVFMGFINQLSYLGGPTLYGWLILSCLVVWKCLEPWNYIYFMAFHSVGKKVNNWRTHIFQRGRPTANQWAISINLSFGHIDVYPEMCWDMLGCVGCSNRKTNWVEICWTSWLLSCPSARLTQTWQGCVQAYPPSLSVCCWVVHKPIWYHVWRIWAIQIIQTNLLDRVFSGHEPTCLKR